MKRIIAYCSLILPVLFPSTCFSNERMAEYQVKAVFLYKFLFFTKWPEDALNQSGETVTIGILGDDPFGDTFDDVDGEMIDQKRLAFKRFDKGFSSDALRECHILFISRSLKVRTKTILASLEGYPVLTVSEIKSFIKLGGMINFIVKKDKIGFQINQSAAERVGIKMSSKLLRLAVKTTEK